MCLEKFIQSYIVQYPQTPVVQIAQHMFTSGIKQNVIIYFFKKKLFLHPQIDIILMNLVNLKDKPVESVFYCLSTTATPHHGLVFQVIVACTEARIPPVKIKETVFSLVNKSKTIQAISEDIVAYLTLIKFYPEKPCFIVNLLIDLSSAGKLSPNTGTWLIDASTKLSHKEIRKILLG